MPRDFVDSFGQHKEPVLVGGNNTIWLDEPGAVWVVETGRVELFVVPGNRDSGKGRRFHLLSIRPDQALFGVSRESLPVGWQLLVSGLPGTQLRKMPWKEFVSSNLTGLLEEWMSLLTAAVLRERVPTNFINLAPAVKYQVNGTQLLSVGQGLIWAVPRQGRLTWLGNQENVVAEGTAVPVTPGSWLEAADGSLLEIMTSKAWLAKSPLTDLGNYYLLLFRHWLLLHNQVQKEERSRLQKKLAQQQGAMEESLRNLADVGRSSRARGDRWSENNPLWSACRRVGEAANIDILPLPPELQANPSPDPLEDIAKVSQIRTRQVVLKGEWWRSDSGPLLAYLEEDDRPVALLPVRSGAYELYDPAAQTTTRVNRTVAGEIKPFAYTFYRSFPAQVMRVRDLLRFTAKSKVRRDLFMVLLTGIAGGLLNLAIPLATGKLVDTIIPQAERGQLGQLTFILIISMLAVAMFELTRDIALLRFEGRINADLEGAVWDRLISLPVPFFRRYSTGDLADRANSINTIRKILSGVTITAIISGGFSSFNFFLLFAYDMKLALMALIIIVAAVAFTAAFGLLQVREQRELAELGGKIQGLVLQLIRGVAKFSVAGAETRAFALWARLFGEMRRVHWQAKKITNYSTTFNAILPVLASLLLYASAGKAFANGFTTGGFVAFYSAFSTFMIAMTATTGALVASINVMPLYQRVRPVLETLPEIDQAKAAPGELSGDIEINHVYFRYDEDGPYILKDVSLQVQPGEFVAVVGPSGSGKSTLLRLLLGFEQAQSGTVYYDGQDLSQLDLQAVRRQLGVVLQNSQLMSGDIYSNIVGSKRLTVKDAEEAARLAGLDEDIRQMPMGMFTLVSEGGTTLSGGQCQRLLIARAIACKPRVIFFDEATSALDNHTQAIVSRSLESLKATRVVIAHRLSTIINADRIVVMEQGKVVQTGNYQELINQAGLFAELAKRQLA